MNASSPLDNPRPAWWWRVYSSSGRARRLEYGIYLMVFLMLSYMFSRFYASFLVVPQHSGSAPESVIGLAMMGAATFCFGFLPYLFATIRRLHDFNQKGIWALLCFVPVIGQVAAIVLTVIEGNRGTNKYGPNPKTEEMPKEMNKGNHNRSDTHHTNLAETDNELPNSEAGL